jgi:hypothetical protein
MVAQKTINRFLSWRENNQNYLQFGRPSKKTLLKRLNREGFSLCPEELNFLGRLIVEVYEMHKSKKDIIDFEFLLQLQGFFQF